MRTSCCRSVALRTRRCLTSKWTTLCHSACDADQLQLQCSLVLPATLERLFALVTEEPDPSADSVRKFKCVSRVAGVLAALTGLQIPVSGMRNLVQRRVAAGGGGL